MPKENTFFMNNKFPPFSIRSVILSPGYLATVSLACAVTIPVLYYTNKQEREHEYVKSHLEADAVDARVYGPGYSNNDQDNNGTFESYFTDPATSKKHRVRINHETGELTYTLLR